MIKTIRDFEFKNKRVLVRCDFDVPLNEKGEILDDFRIRQAISTIKYLINEKAKVILMGHLGRPDGKALEELRLTPIQNKLMEELDVSITKTQDCIGEEIEKRTREMAGGDVLLLENLRFHIGEQENDDNFSRELSKLGDIYINNAFANSHRNHASMTGVPKYLPSAAGLTLEKEIKSLSSLTENPRKPLVAIIGGKKVETTKLKLINKFSEKGNWVLIGDLVKKALKEKNVELEHPQQIIEPVDEVQGKDIGPKTINIFKEKITKAKTIFWNGPLGLVEKEEFSRGTEELLKAISESKAFSVVGGGDTTKVVFRLGLTDKFNHVSTGGGAMLAYLAGEKLPGIEALDKS